jgi:hypothetical protein
VVSLPLSQVLIHLVSQVVNHLVLLAVSHRDNPVLNHPENQVVSQVHRQVHSPRRIQAVCLQRSPAQFHLDNPATSHLECLALSQAFNHQVNLVFNPAAGPVVSRPRTLLMFIRWVWRHQAGEQTRPLWCGRWTIWGTRTTTHRCI